MQLDPPGSDKILKYGYKLKNKPFWINTQLPPALNERRRQLVPLSKAAKLENKKVRWSRDTLYVDGVQHKAKKDIVTDINQDVTERAVDQHVIRAPPKTYKSSVFQGCKVRIGNQDDIIPSLHAIYKDTRCAKATHNIYAYRLKTPNGITEHYEDDNEHGAGHHILQKLRNMDITDCLVCVSRWYGGEHLGPDRFKYIEEAVSLVSSM